MLPSSKKSLQEGGLSERAASWALVGLFVIGAFGIQYLSRIMHHFLPSHVVDCDHTHDEDDEEEMDSCEDEENIIPEEQPPTHLRHPGDWINKTTLHLSYSRASQPPERTNSGKWKDYLTTKTSCDKVGPCLGYSEPCGVDCFRT